ncbi:DUF4303 domain-containing protein [Actinomadura adrarensis]|uniref:DUF4303 domain-containing protein n=1 Tax=Actinomadura adrarensis TaxID=1819600 RepID=A0ABW3CMN4_9ACTN
MPGDVLGRAEMSALQERVVASLCATVGPMLKERASVELYALAITTDRDVVTLRVVAHTEEALRTLLEGDEEDADHYRWWPDEWGISDDDVTPEKRCRGAERHRQGHVRGRRLTR